jgi:TRAP-type uncharacterized transport system substrate-binding protein
MRATMRRWRPLGIALAVGAAASLVLAALAPFLAPNLTYEIQDRVIELLSGNRARTYKIALGTSTGSYFKLGEVLNEHLMGKAGYGLELVSTTGVPKNVAAILDPAQEIHLATVDSASDEAANANELVALAAIERPYFFVMVPNDSPAREVRDLSGAVDTAAWAPGEGPTLGDKVLEYYRLIGPGPATVMRPSGGMVQRLDAGDVTAVTRTQFLSRGLIDTVLDTGRYRLLPINDHESLARAIPGTEPGFIPAGAYGPGRRIPPAPVPTLVLTSLLVARRDLPGRVVRDLLDTIYDPGFARAIHYELTEESGRKVAPYRLHPAAEIYYHRNDLLTSDRMGRVSFVASIVAGAFATMQFVLLLRRNERRKARRSLLLADLEKLRVIRLGIESAPSEADARAMIAEADDLLWKAEQDAAADRLDREGIETLRSLHAVCWRALPHRANAPDPQLTQT